MKAVFLGGPADGTERDVPPELTRICIPYTSEERVCEPYCNNTGATGVLIEYKAKRFREGNHEYIVFLEDGQSSVIARLLDWYAKKNETIEQLRHMMRSMSRG